VTVGADDPIMKRGSGSNGLDVNEIENLIVRRIAVEMEERNRRRSHAQT